MVAVESGISPRELLACDPRDLEAIVDYIRARAKRMEKAMLS